ncbi:MAG TPA: nucleotidyltransferase family protein [Fimbriimonadales bacterium]|nr:nucleotidyltransferase family protein [Fimbriimonadales bacterium]
MNSKASNWAAIIAAGGFAPPDIRRASGENFKALARVGGTPAIQYVYRACLHASFERIIIAAPEEVHRVIEPSSNTIFVQSGETNIRTARNGLEKCDEQAFCFLPCDTPLLSDAHLRDFRSKILERLEVPLDSSWFAIGLSPATEVCKSFPEFRYRFLRFREGRFASGALLAASRKGFESTFELLEEASQNRKRFWKLFFEIGKKLGMIDIARYLSGKIDIREAEKRVGELLGGQAIIVPDCSPATTLDFDTAKEWMTINEHWEKLRRKNL